MDRRNEIVRELARGKVVEEMAQNIAHSPLSSDLEDLCQMVYFVILTYDPDKVAELWDKGEIRFFIARIILNQYRSKTSPFHSEIRRFRERSDAIGQAKDKQDEG